MYNRAGNRTPSAIDIDEVSDRQRWESHESYGYPKTGDDSYSLPDSPTPPNPLALSDPPSAINPTDENENDDYLPNIGDTSLVSSKIPGDSDYNQGNITGILDQAIEQGRSSSHQQQFSIEPPRKVSHRYFWEYTSDIRDPRAAYTQALIWCLEKRLARLKRSPPQEITTSRIIQIQTILKRMQLRLLNGSIVPKWQTHELLNLKPKLQNPENQKWTEMIPTLDAYRKQLLVQLRNGWNLLQHTQNSYANNPLPLDSSSEPIQSTPNSYISSVEEKFAQAIETTRSILESINHIDALSATAMSTIIETLESRQQLLECLEASLVSRRG